MKEKIEQPSVPLRIVRHFPLYLNWIQERISEGVDFISAAELASAMGFDPVVTRKELAITGVIGTPRKGFPAKELEKAITICLGWDNVKEAVIVGAGSLGSALLGYQGFKDHSLEICLAFDADPKKIGTKIHGVKIMDVKDLEEFVKRMKIHLAILTVPKEFAQDCADKLISAGVRGIWNFSPIKLNAPTTVHVENADLAAGLAALSHMIR